MTVRWTDSSLDDIQALETYIARRSPRYARGMVARIFQRGDSLGPQPLSGPTLPGYEELGLREVFESPYRIIYRLTGEHVEIIDMVHASRRLSKTLGGNL